MPVLARLSTIRARMTIAATLVVAAALVLTGLVSVIVLRRTLVNNIDDGVRRRADEISHLVREGTVPRTLAASDDEATTVVQVLDKDGTVTARTQNVRDAPPVLSADQRRAGGPRTVSGLPVPDEHEDEFRVVVRTVDLGSGRMTVIAAESIEIANESVATARRVLSLGLLPVLLLVAATSWVVVGRALRPVDAMRRQVADISGGDLSQRVHEPATDDEIGRLARTMNDMLERLDAAAERQRRFVADASHELQSPLAATIAELEVAMRNPSQARWEETAAGVASDAQRMTSLVRDLLFLAQADNAKAPLPQTLIDLDDVVRSEVSRLRMPNGVTVDVAGVQPAEVRGDTEQLARVLRNLLDNAVRYAQHRISLDLVAANGTARLVVADDGPGVPPDMREQVFERFTRADDSRTRETGGTGLGLAIAKEIVESHGGTIELESGVSGARFVVKLPTPV